MNLADDRGEMPGWLVATLTIIGLMLAAVGAAVGIALLPSSQGGLRVLCTFILVIAIVVAVVSCVVWLVRSGILRALRRERQLRAQVEELRELLVSSRRSTDDYKRVLWDVASRHHHTYAESFHFWMYIGEDVRGDRVQEEYATTATSQHGLLWRGVDVWSSTAAAVAGGRLSLASADVQVTVLHAAGTAPQAGPTFQTKLVEMLCEGEDRRIAGMVIFQPEVSRGQTVNWRVTYEAPGTWSNLRQTGEDHYEITLDRRCPSIHLEFIFAKAAPNATCAVEIPQAARTRGISQSCGQTTLGGVTKVEWLATNAPAGKYRFNLRT